MFKEGLNVGGNVGLWNFDSGLLVFVEAATNFLLEGFKGVSFGRCIVLLDTFGLID